MNRRDFLTKVIPATVAATTLPVTQVSASPVKEIQEEEVLRLAKELYYMFDCSGTRDWDNPAVAWVKKHCIAHARYLLAQYKLIPKPTWFNDYGTSGNGCHG